MQFADPSLKLSSSESIQVFMNPYRPVYIYDFSLKLRRVGLALRLGTSLHFPRFLRFSLEYILSRIYSDKMTYGFEFDLSKDFQIPEPESPMIIRELQKNDMARLLYAKIASINNLEFKIRTIILDFILADIKTCYVGVNKEGIPCVICWLITPDENEKLQMLLNYGFPPLKPNEVMCECLFTHPDYRGLRLGTWLTLSLYRKASEFGAKRAIVYIDAANRASIKVSLRNGSTPFTIRNIRWRLFKRRIRYLASNSLDC